MLRPRKGHNRHCSEFEELPLKIFFVLVHVIDEGFHVFGGGIDKFDSDLIEVLFVGSDPFDFALYDEGFMELRQRELDL